MLVQEDGREWNRRYPFYLDRFKDIASLMIMLDASVCDPYQMIEFDCGGL